ncbi:MAG: transposase [Pseudomonadota bacterium]
MTFVQQLKQEALQQGRHEGILLVAKRLLIEEGMPPQVVQKLTGLPEKEVMDLVDKH